jgi:ISXO2-like transposase domain
VKAGRCPDPPRAGRPLEPGSFGGGLDLNILESHCALLKRDVYGTFNNIGEGHLHWYPAEFDFRANTRDPSDWDRAAMLLADAKRKRLVYHQAYRNKDT